MSPRMLAGPSMQVVDPALDLCLPFKAMWSPITPQDYYSMQLLTALR